LRENLCKLSVGKTKSFKCRLMVILPDSDQGDPMREIAIIITAMAALSAMSRGDAHFVPLPTGPSPAVNVP
jgi:hypothetical protein